MRVTPGSALPTSQQLVVEVDAPDTSSGSAALVETRLRDGRVQVAPIALDAAGNGSQVVGFDRRQVSVGHGGVRQHQHRHEGLREDLDDDGPLYSCSGRGVLDAQPFSVRERLL